MGGRQVEAVAILGIILAACGTGAERPSPVSPSPAPSPTPALTAGSTSSPAEVTAGPTSTADPTPEPIVLGGTWVRPKAGARLTSYTTTLRAKPTGKGDGVTTFTKVVFRATWEGGSKVACTARTPDDNRVWSCKSNLIALGVPPGPVSLTFDVHGVGVPVARAPDGPRDVTYAVRPPEPTRTRLDQLEQPDYNRGGNLNVLHRVRWSAPDGYADEFLVYETSECPRPSTERNANKPCFVAGTPVDVSQLHLLARAPGNARSVKFRMTEYECGPAHGSILLRARNAYGGSVFAIVESAPVLWAAPGELIC